MIYLFEMEFMSNISKTVYKTLIFVVSFTLFQFLSLSSEKSEKNTLFQFLPGVLEEIAFLRRNRSLTRIAP